VRFRFIREHTLRYPIKHLCFILNVSRSRYYEWLRQQQVKPDPEQQRLEACMRKLFVESNSSMGSRRLAWRLQEQGFVAGRYRVRRLMKKLGLVVKQKRKFRITTNSNHKLPVAENILDRQFNPATPNQAWAADITYIWTAEGWLYLAVVIDLYSRRVVGWSMDKRQTKSLVIRALMMAVNMRKPSVGLIHHSDRGSQYASLKYQASLKQHGIVCSMSRKGNCWDNAVVERFFSSLKREWIRDNLYRTREEAIRDVRAYIVTWYNSRRPHSTLGYKSPIEFEKCA
jgi:putative transposase